MDRIPFSWGYGQPRLLSSWGCELLAFLLGYEPAPHGAGTHNIEGKKWQEKAGHVAGDFRKGLALMATKWDSYRMVHFRNRPQKFFRATRGR